MSKTALTAKQKLFAIEYAACLNATVAARKAGYSGDDNALAVRGAENVRNSKVKAYIDQLLDEQAMAPREILARLSAHGRGDMGDFINPETGDLDLDYAKSRGITHLIKKVKSTITIKGEKVIKRTEIEIHDPQSALVHLGRAHAMFTDKQEQVDWRSKAIDDIKAGNITFDALAEAFDGELARQLFLQAGVPVE